MQIPDAPIRARLEDDLRACWNPTNLRPDAPRVAQNAADLPDVRVHLLDGEVQGQGPGSAARDVVVPLTYEITGRWAYPASGTVNEAQVSRLNAFLAVFTADYPRYAGWRYQESVGWVFDDQAEERTYTVTVTVTIEAIVRAGN